jgi:hypothetical protein
MSSSLLEFGCGRSLSHVRSSGIGTTTPGVARSLRVALERTLEGNKAQEGQDAHHWKRCGDITDSTVEQGLEVDGFARSGTTRGQRPR